MIDVYTELKSIIIALAENKIEYAVCGGWAMAIHGAPRTTIDIDLLILTEDLNKVLMIAKTLDYQFEASPMSFHDGHIEIRRISKIDGESDFVLSLDLLLVTSVLRDVWQTKKQLELFENSISVVSREGLIKLKTISGRGQDLVDIERLKELTNES